MSPVDLGNIFERAKDSYRVRDYEAAERLLKSFVARFPENREANLLLGNTFAREGKLFEAEIQYITLLSRNPRDLEALNNVAVVCRRQGKLHEALVFLKEAVELNPGKVEFLYNTGNIYKEIGNLKEAAIFYSRVIELDPGYVMAYNNLGNTYNQLKEHDKALVVFRKGLAKDQNNPSLHFNYGIALEAKGRFEDAANEYRAAARSRPGWLEPMNKLGMALFLQGKHNKAISTFERVLYADPLNVEARNNIGVVMADQGRTGEAIKNFRLAIESNQAYANAVLNLERALEVSGNIADAVIELEKLIMFSPDNINIRNRLSELYLKMKRYPESLEQAEATLKLEPDNITALKAKGAVMRVLGNETEAQSCFERILSLNPDNYSFLLDLADIYFNRKEYKEAQKRIQSYLIQKPQDRDAKFLLGKLFSAMGNKTNALQIFEEISKADPNDTEAMAAVAELHKESGSIEKALLTADTLVNIQGNRATADDLSELNKSLELYESAVNAYSHSVKDRWSKNMELMGSDEPGLITEDDFAPLIETGTKPPERDEEVEGRFTEDVDLFLDDERFGKITESIQSQDEVKKPRYEDPLDALAENADKFQEALFPEDTSPAPSGGKSPAPPEIPPAPTVILHAQVLPDSSMHPYPGYPYPGQPVYLLVNPAQTKPQRLVHEEEAVLEDPDSDTGGKSSIDETDKDTGEKAGSDEINKAVELLDTLKGLTSALPEKQRESYNRGKLHTTLESVIDSLKNLTIIKESKDGDIDGSGC